jgi:hypothetical protein
MRLPYKNTRSAILTTFETNLRSINDTGKHDLTSLIPLYYHFLHYIVMHKISKNVAPFIQTYAIHTPFPTASDIMANPSDKSHYNARLPPLHNFGPNIHPSRWSSRHATLNFHVLLIILLFIIQLKLKSSNPSS